MATRLQLRKGSATEHNTFTGANGEVTVDTTNKTLRVHDGTTVGGTRLATLTGGLVPTTQLPAATTSGQGVVQFATQSEVNTGTNTTKAMTPNTLSGGVRTLLNASGDAPMYTCRAWVNFNSVPLSGTYSQSGTTVTVTMTAHGMSVGQDVNLAITSGTAVSGSYTVATVVDANTFTYTAGTSLTTSGIITRNHFIRASGNVLSITDDGVGLYTITFIYDMPSTGYAVIGNTTQPVTGAAQSANVLALRSSSAGTLYNKTVSSFSIITVDNNADSLYDSNEIGIGVFA